MEKSLRSLNVERIWPVLSPVHLAYLELKQDPYFMYLPKEKIPEYLTSTIAYGKDVAQQQTPYHRLQDLLNHLLQQRIKICFRQKHPNDPQIRAQYTSRPPTIEIFQNSIQQIQAFCDRSMARIAETDLMILHLYHEYFHHLETHTIQRADLRLEKCTIKQWGPFSLKKSLRSLREIAAHAFAQAMMQLNWSPLLLDRLIYYTHLGWSHLQIREHFFEVRKEFESLNKDLESL